MSQNDDFPQQDPAPGTAPAESIPAPMPVSVRHDPLKARVAMAAALRVGVDMGETQGPETLPPDEAAYALEFALSADPKRARAAAGWSVETAREKRKSPRIQRAIAHARETTAARYQASADALIAELQAIAHADARELVSYVYDPCPECWPDERDAETDVPPTPDPRCKICRGEGVGSTRVSDTRDLSESGRALFAGIKQTQHGTYVLTHSKMDAIEKLLKIFGAYEADNRQKLAPITELLEYVATNRQGLPIRR